MRNKKMFDLDNDGQGHGVQHSNDAEFDGEYQPL